jgi:ribokinase
VLRDGKITLSAPLAEVTRESVIGAMLGRTLTEFYPRRKNEPSAEPFLTLSGVGTDGLGDDLFGRQARAVLAAEGLPDWGILTGQAPTGVAFILVDAAAENMIAIAPGANLDLVPADVTALEERVREADVVLVQLECEAALAVGVAAWARASGKRAILNPAPARELSIADLKAFEIITPNETELSALAAAAGTGGDGPAAQAEALARAGVPNVVVTLGADGALWASADGVRAFPAPAVRAVDTTGAGDAFNAGLAAALARGQSLPDAVEYGCRAGAFCVTRRGVIDGLAHPADLETLEDG